jgi:hypothetical protein
MNIPVPAGGTPDEGCASMREHKPDHRQKPDEFNNIAMNNTRTKHPGR